MAEEILCLQSEAAEFLAAPKSEQSQILRELQSTHETKVERMANSRCVFEIGCLAASQGCQSKLIVRTSLNGRVPYEARVTVMLDCQAV